VGVWQLFYYNRNAENLGPWLVYVAYGLILAGAAVGPRRHTPATVPPRFTQPPPFAPPAPVQRPPESR
jgi:hypothetical protein